MDSTTVLAAAAVAFVVVILGGIITAGASFVAIRRVRDVRPLRPDDILMASRLVGAELERAKSVVHLALHSRRWWTGRDAFKADAWHKYGALIAPSMPPAKWSAVTRGYTVIAELSNLDVIPGSFISDDQIARIGSFAEHLTHGYLALIYPLQKRGVGG